MTREDLRELRDNVIAEIIFFIPEGSANKQKVLDEQYKLGLTEAINVVRKQFAEYEKILFPEKPTDAPPSLIAKQDFLKLPMEERRKILEKQAVELAAYYNANPDINGLGGGDFEKEKA